MKSYNILSIIFLLLSDGDTTVKTLSEKLEVSTRTVKRYIATIISLGIPIETIPGRNGGIHFDREEFNRQFGAGTRELDGLLDAICVNQPLNFLFQGRYVDFSEFFRKLKVNAAVEIDFSKWVSNAKDDINFSIIKRAIVSLRQIEFEYYDMYNRSSHRVIDPYKIGFKENNWYVLGICHLRNDIRVFKMRKMRNVKLLDTQFTKKDHINFDFAAYYSSSAKKVLVMEISKEAVAKAYEDFEEYEITKLDDRLLVKSERIDGPSLMPLVLSYGGYAKVVSPPEVIDDLGKHIEILKNIYKR